jgi:hypothetical protein
MEVTADPVGYRGTGKTYDDPAGEFRDTPVSAVLPVIGIALRRLSTKVPPYALCEYTCDAPVSAVLPVIMAELRTLPLLDGRLAWVRWFRGGAGSLDPSLPDGELPYADELCDTPVSAVLPVIVAELRTVPPDDRLAWVEPG